MNKIKGILTTIILIIIIIGILIGMSYAAITAPNGFSIDRDAKLAYYAIKCKVEFLSNDKIFAFAGKNIDAEGYSELNSYENAATTSSAGACLAHTQNTRINDNEKEMLITDVLDMTSTKVRYKNASTNDEIKEIDATAYTTALSYLMYQNNTSSSVNNRAAIQAYFYDRVKTASSLKDLLSSNFKDYYINNVDWNEKTSSSLVANNLHKTVSAENEANKILNATKNLKNITIKENEMTVNNYGTYTYIGPVNVDYTKNNDKTLSGVTINLTVRDAKGTELAIHSIAEEDNGSRTAYANRNIKSDTDFYIVLANDNNKNVDLSSIRIKAQAKGPDEYHTRMILLISRKAGGQTETIYASEKIPIESIASRDYEFKKNITIIKKDADNESEPLTAGFIVYYKDKNNVPQYVKLNNNEIAYDTNKANAQVFYTDANNGGRKTIVGLKSDVEFYIEEVDAPNSYRLELQDENKTMIGISEREKTIKNKKYGDLLILKIDQDTDKLISNIKFYIKAMNTENGQYEYIRSFEYIGEGESKRVSKINTTTEKEEACIFTTVDGKIELKNIPTGIYKYQEDYQSMTENGYASDDTTITDGTIENEWKEVQVEGKGDERVSSLDYINTLRNIFNSDYVRQQIAKNDMTDIELAEKIYNATISILNDNDKNNFKFDISKHYNLLIQEACSGGGLTFGQLQSLNRINRYDTINNILNISFDNKDTENVIFVTTMSNNNNTVNDYRTALSLGASLDAPIFAVNNDGKLDDTVKEKLKSYTSLNKVYIVGGTVAISDDIKTEIANVNNNSITYDRIFNNDNTGSIGTSIEVAKRVRENGGKKDSIIVAFVGDNIDTSLSATLSASNKIPVVYVNPNDFNRKSIILSNTESLSTKNYILSIKDDLKNIYFIGGIAEDYAEAFKDLGDKVKLITGEFRYDTNLSIIDTFYSDKSKINNVIFVKNGTGIVDMTSAGQMVVNGDTVLFLLPDPNDITGEYCEDPEVMNIQEYIHNNKILQNVLKNEGNIYTIYGENPKLDIEINKWIKQAHYSIYTGTSLKSLIHENCLYGDDNTTCYVSCNHNDNCKCGKYCYDKISDNNSYLVGITKILKTDVKYSKLRDKLKVVLNKGTMSSSDYEKKIYSNVEKIYKGIFEVIDFDENFKTSYLKHYTSKLLGISSVRITNKYDGHAKLSGRVWLDQHNGKDNSMDALYNTGVDIDLEGITVELMRQDEEQPLANTTTGKDGTYVFDQKDSNGKYLIDLSQKDQYYVRFTYDGLEYTSVVLNKDNVNGSKAKEVAADRNNLNNQFNEINLDKTNKINNGDINKNITATTSEAEYTLPDAILIENKENGKEEYEIKNVNLGLVGREKPDLELTEELKNAIVSVNGYEQTYDYNSEYAGENYSDKTVMFNGKEVGMYTRPIYPSDIKLAEGDNSKLQIFMTYKITLKNNSDTVIAKVNQIENHYDANCSYAEITGAKWENSEKTDKDGRKIGYMSIENEIDPNGGTHEILLKLKVDTESTVTALLSGNDVIVNNISEISSYTSYYNENTYEGATITAGEIYAGLDKDSIPGNNIIKPISSKNGVTTGEDDGDFAKAFKIKLSSVDRTISGTVWKDNDDNENDEEIKGNGIIDDSEKSRFSGVTVDVIPASVTGNDEKDREASAVNTYKLKKDAEGKHIINTSTGKYEYEESAIATAITDENGNYTISGLLPGEYKLRYTYMDGTTKIVDADKKETDIKVRNYKSTILNSDSPSGSAYGNENVNWIQNKKSTRYNDARDNLKTRNSIDNNNSITFNWVDSSNDIMDAYTPKFVLGVELTEVSKLDSKYYSKSNAYDSNGKLIDYSSVENIDFGIIERPKQNAEISKNITYVKVTLSNGQVLIEGDPSKKEAKITYVKTGLDGTVPMELDDELFPVTVEIKYTITVKDTSDLDYVGSDGKCDPGYYYYGDKTTTGIKEKAIKINKIIDYLPSDMIYDETKSEGNWTQITNIDEELKNKGLISEEVAKDISSGYTVLVTKGNVFDGLNKSNSVSVDLYAKTTMTATDKDRTVTNWAEIIDYNSTTIISDTEGNIATPGNLNPKSVYETTEADSDSIEFVITKPMGQNKDYTSYYILGVSILVILGLGIVIIKKKVINK